MHFIQLNKIYMELARRYKCNRFEVFNNMNIVGSSPVETMIEFYLAKNTIVDQKNLVKMLKPFPLRVALLAYSWKFRRVRNTLLVAIYNIYIYAYHPIL